MLSIKDFEQNMEFINIILDHPDRYYLKKKSDKFIGALYWFYYLNLI
jgi:hypothetical protein